jgi:hypothetical protein
MRELPKIKAFGKEYYFDHRLRELRNTEDPSDRITISHTDADGVDYLIERKAKVDWDDILIDYDPNEFQPVRERI